jgi:glycerophosphoryl diester phosphodiesterase
MIIISHRGYWLEDKEKNTLESFERSFSFGFGVETDIRDISGKLVISHDLANSDCVLLEVFFELYLRYSARPMLALNIKSNGLQLELKQQLDVFGIENYFVFDMAVPDGLAYIKSGIKTFTRQSEYEPVPSYYNLANGIWLDEFNDHWLTNEIIEKHISLGKFVCVVSPELHNRSPEPEWEQYKELEKKIGKDKLMICTDFPERAFEVFNA